MKLSLVPREMRFYQLFQQQGSLVCETLGELSRSLSQGTSHHDRLRELEHTCDDVALEIYTLTNRTFTTPMEPEDILQLAHTLDGIVDLAEEVSDKIDLYKASPIPEPAVRFGDRLAKAGLLLERALASLDDSNAVAPVLQEIHSLENDGDRITRQALQKLFNGRTRSAVDLIKWKDLYDLLEATMDKCETVAEMIETIAIKNA